MCRDSFGHGGNSLAITFGKLPRLACRGIKKDMSDGIDRDDVQVGIKHDVTGILEQHKQLLIDEPHTAGKIETYSFILRCELRCTAGDPSYTGDNQKI